jgi:hypothetical protein
MDAEFLRTEIRPHHSRLDLCPMARRA